MGDELFLGPDASGAFRPVRVYSIMRNGKSYTSVVAGQMASFALHGVERHNIRTGQALLARENLALHACLDFDAEIYLLSNTTEISQKYQVCCVGSGNDDRIDV